MLYSSDKKKVNGFGIKCLQKLSAIRNIQLVFMNLKHIFPEKKVCTVFYNFHNHFRILTEKNEKIL